MENGHFEWTNINTERQAARNNQGALMITCNEEESRIFKPLQCDYKNLAFSN